MCTVVVVFKVMNVILLTVERVHKIDIVTTMPKKGISMNPLSSEVHEHWRHMDNRRGL